MNLTLEQAYNKYLEYANLKLKPTTLLTFKRNVKLHILPYFKKTKIKKIDFNMYVEWQKDLTKKGYSYTFKRNCHYCMCSIYNYLCTFYGVNKNIPRMVGNFKEIEYKKNKIDFWTYEEFKNFIKCVDNPVYNTLFNTLFFTGLRKGELLALTFEDIDFNKQILKINKTISKEKFNGERLIICPKTKKSIRNIPIDILLNEKLKSLREYYISQFNDFNNNFYIFGGNKPISTTTLERKKNFYCEKAGVKKIRLHDFRHSHATLLYKLDTPVDVISKRLGHSSVNITLNVYIHDIEEKEKRAVEMLSSLN